MAAHHKAEAAGCHVSLMQPHDDTLDVPALGEGLPATRTKKGGRGRAPITQMQSICGTGWVAPGESAPHSPLHALCGAHLVQLLLGGEEREVPNIDCGGCPQTLLKGLLEGPKDLCIRTGGPPKVMRAG